MTKQNSSAWKLVCTECGASYAESEVRYVCPRCAEQQIAGGLTRGILEVAWEPQVLRDGWEASLRRDRGLGVERFRSMLPLGPKAPVLALRVGDTPMLEVLRLRQRLGMSHLYVKDETRNPSASYKDRASALVCLKAAEYGEPMVVAASTGNAATALACISASLGQRALILVPAAAPKAKLVQMLNYGAQVVPVQGTYDEAFELSLEATRLYGWYNRNTAFNPFTVEGKKTSSYEMVLDLGGRAPDAVIVPTGDGVILSGIAKGFRDLYAAGVISRLPRLIAAQAAGSASIATAVRTPSGTPQAVVDAHTVADSISVAAPRAGLLAAKEIRHSKGSGVIVTDDAILDSIGELARFAGLFAEPAGATALAGLHQALKEGLVSREESVVLMVTGHGLKDINAASQKILIPEPIPPNATALRDRLRG